MPLHSIPQSLIETTKTLHCRISVKNARLTSLQKIRYIQEYHKEEQTYKRKALKNSTFRTPFLSSP